MLEVLYFSQKDVKTRLLERALQPASLLLVTAVRHGDHMRPVEEREPFLALERRFGDLLVCVVVADDGKLEGMWRDPMGDLADRLFPQDGQQAFAAAHGYLLLVDGEVEAVLKKQSDPGADLWFLQEALAAAHPQVPRPDPAKRPRASQAPGHRTAAPGGSGSSRTPDSAQQGSGSSRQRRPEEAGPDQQRRTGASRHPPEDEAGPRNQRRRSGGDGASGPDPWGETNPWTLLGIAGDVTLAEGRKAFRTLIAQYHPDKVQHLAPEFRELAERRTRQIVAAWEEIERALK
ncbi:MAG: J domain-containing protein [Myxococcota bacterium]|nr:J domain-containing protein [Myxococcota bacterium]